MTLICYNTQRTLISNLLLIKYIIDKKRIYEQRAADSAFEIQKKVLP